MFRKYKPPVINTTANSNETNTSDLLITDKLKTMFENLKNVLILQLMPTKQKFLFVILCSIIFALFTGLASSQLSYISTFAQLCGLKMTAQSATNFNTYLAISGLMSQIMAIPLSKYLNPKLIILCGLSLILVSEILLLIFANYSQIVFIISVVIFGVGIGPQAAAVLQMTNMFTPVTNLIATIYIFMANIMETIVLAILANMMQTNPFSMAYLEIILTVLAFVLLFSICLISRK